MTQVESQPAPAKLGEKKIIPCNFRSASRMSNEDARVLTAMYEDFAWKLTAALDGYLGTGVEVRVSAPAQMRFEEHIAVIPPTSCIVPFAVSKIPLPLLIECDIGLALPMIDLLLGGDGAPTTENRELSEIETEIVLEVFSLIVSQAEIVWNLPPNSMTAGRRLKPRVLEQCCPRSENVTCLKFTAKIGEVTGAFHLVLPSLFLTFLLQQLNRDQPLKKKRVRYFPVTGIRERILHSDVEVSVELPDMKIAVKDLLALLPGSVLKMRVPARTPSVLTAGGHGIFEAIPVRNGSRKAAQLGRRIALTSLERI